MLASIPSTGKREPEEPGRPRYCNTEEQAATMFRNCRTRMAVCSLAIGGSNRGMTVKFTTRRLHESYGAIAGGDA